LKNKNRKKKNDLHKLGLIERHLNAHFGIDSVVRNQENKSIKITFDGTEAVYKLDSRSIECADEQLKEQLEELMKYIHGAVFPIKERQKTNTMG